MPLEIDNGSPNQWRTISRQQPFANWVVLERQRGYSVEHGSARFSLLYLCCEGAAGYQALYNSNQVKPKILYLVQHAWAGNPTNFEDPKKILARSVRANSQGLPEYLVGREVRDTHHSHWPDEYPGNPLAETPDAEFFVWASSTIK